MTEPLPMRSRCAERQFQPITLMLCAHCITTRENFKDRTVILVVLFQSLSHREGKVLGREVCLFVPIPLLSTLLPRRGCMGKSDPLSVPYTCKPRTEILRVGVVHRLSTKEK